MSTHKKTHNIKGLRKQLKTILIDEFSRSSYNHLTKDPASIFFRSIDAEKHLYWINWSISEMDSELFLIREFEKDSRSTAVLPLNISPLKKSHDYKNYKIKINRSWIKSNYYNSLQHNNIKITKSNCLFLDKLIKLYDLPTNFDYIKVLDYEVINTSYLEIKNLKSIDYIEKYTLYQDSMYLVSTDKECFKRGLNDALTEAYSKNMFGKEFKHLNDKEIDILKIYLY